MKNFALFLCLYFLATLSAKSQCDPDTIAPVIAQCAPDVTEQVNAACNFYVPYYTQLVVASDNCDTSLYITQSPAAGTIMSGEGITSITLTATDASGNFTNCTFSVYRVDDILPTITCPENITAYAAAGMCTATIASLGTPTTADNCSVAAVTNDHPSTTYPVGPTTVIWTVTDASGNITTCTQTVNVIENSVEDAIAPADFETCNVTNTISANEPPAGYTGMWSFAQGSGSFADATSANTTVTFNSTGIHILQWTITGTDSGCGIPTSSDLLTVSYYFPEDCPPANAGYDIDACLGSDINLNATEIVTPLMGQWTQIAGPSIGIFQNANDHNTMFIANQPGSYILRWTRLATPCCAEHSDDVVINVFDCSNCTVNAGADFTVCMGDAVQLQAVASGIGPFTYNWSPAMGLSNAAISNPFASPAFTVSYTVTVSNAFGCTASDNVVVTVNPLPVVNAGNDITVCSNPSPTQLTGFSPTGGTWSGNGVNATGMFAPSSPGAYTLIYSYTNGTGCTATDELVANVLETPVVSAGLDATICIGGTTQLIGAPAGGAWSGAPFITTNGLFNASAVGTYTLTYTYINQQGCAASDQMSMTVAPLPVVNAGNDIVICPGDVATLCATAASANGPIVTYTWLPGVFFNACIEVDPANTTSYTVAVVDAAGCQAANQVVVMINSNTGCTDPEAANYNAAATCDDGSCSYLGGDFNGDGAVSIEEFNIVLGNFGCTSPACSASDLDNDGMVGMSDLLILIGNMGG